VTDKSSLKEFFAKIWEDEVLFERYKKDPEQVLKEFGLSAEAILAIVTGDLKAIRRLLGNHEPPGIHVIVIRRK